VLRQIEGSRGVAETVARCRPEVVARIPSPPDAHNRSDWRDGKGGTALAVRVHQRRVGVRGHVGVDRRVRGRREAYTATASQGLLFMMEAVYNAPLGLPIVMTLANRAIGAPINIWNDHSDAMAARDAGWIQLFARPTRRPRTARSRVRLAEELSLTGHGLHGRLHPDARRRRHRRARSTRTSTHSCRATSHVKCSIPLTQSHWRNGGTRSLHRSSVPSHLRQLECPRFDSRTRVTVRFNVRSRKRRANPLV